VQDHRDEAWPWVVPLCSDLGSTSRWVEPPKVRTLGYRRRRASWLCSFSYRAESPNTDHSKGLDDRGRRL